MQPSWIAILRPSRRTYGAPQDEERMCMPSPFGLVLRICLPSPVDLILKEAVIAAVSKGAPRRCDAQAFDPIAVPAHARRRDRTRRPRSGPGREIGQHEIRQFGAQR